MSRTTAQRTRAASTAAAAVPRPDASVHASGAVRRGVARVRKGLVQRDDDWIASEVPIALLYNGNPHVVMLATPADLEDFALGFSLSEAIIPSPTQLENVEVRTLIEGIEINAQIPPSYAAAVAARQRNLTGRGGCGLCGTQELADVVRHPPSVGEGPRISFDTLHRALAALGGAQPLNACTGATHAAAWADVHGTLVLVREDVGRHNALDKLIGALAGARIDVRQGFLVVTSRASYEMVQKAATVGIAMLAAISAPTALAIHLAESTGMTLAGFARADGFVLYTHAQRIDTATG